MPGIRGHDAGICDLPPRSRWPESLVTMPECAVTMKRNTQRGQSLADFDAPSAAFAQACLGRSSDLVELDTVLFVLLHLVVRYLLAGQNVSLRWSSIGSQYPASRSRPAMASNRPR